MFGWGGVRTLFKECPNCGGELRTGETRRPSRFGTYGAFYICEHSDFYAFAYPSSLKEARDEWRQRRSALEAHLSSSGDSSGPSRQTIKDSLNRKLDLVESEMRKTKERRRPT